MTGTTVRGGYGAFGLVADTGGCGSASCPSFWRSHYSA